MEQEIEVLLQQEQKTRDVPELKRLQAVRLYGNRQSVDPDDSGSGRLWAMRYQAGGVALASHWQGQNATKLSGDQRSTLRLYDYLNIRQISPLYQIKSHLSHFI
jgi:hypothetical protein